MSNILKHHGIKGMRWGVRRYQNYDGTLTEQGRKKYLNSDGSLNELGKKVAVSNQPVSKILRKQNQNHLLTNYQKEVNSKLKKMDEEEKAQRNAREKRIQNETPKDLTEAFEITKRKYGVKSMDDIYKHPASVKAGKDFVKDMKSQFPEFTINDIKQDTSYWRARENAYYESMGIKIKK